jgi:hypothetical protein
MNRRLLFFAFCLCVLLTSCDMRARVILDNQSECDGILYRFTNTETRQVLEGTVPKNTRREIVVEPDVFYDYLINFKAASTASGAICNYDDQGKLRVPAGASQTFTLLNDPLPPTATPNG